MDRTISVSSDRNIRDLLWRWSTLIGSIISVDRTKCPFPFDKIVVPSTALLYPAYSNNNLTRSGLGRVCATGMSRGRYRSIGYMEFPKFQTRIFVEWKAPIVYQMSTAFLFIFWCGWKGFELFKLVSWSFSHVHVVVILIHWYQGLCLVLEASCKDGGAIISPLIDNLLGGLHSMVSAEILRTSAWV